MTRRAPIRQVEIRRAVSAARSAGVEIGRVEVEGGKVTIIPVDASQTETEAARIERLMQAAFGETV